MEKLLFASGNLVRALNLFDAFLWGRFLIIILVLLGVILTIRLRGMQFRFLWMSLKLAFSRSDDKAQGDVSHFQALMTALAATLGIASIAGVATAIMAGGMGAIFWMWVIALLGMVTRFAEALLAIKYRIKDKRGEMCGGPMYYIDRGLGWKWLASLFAVFAALSAFAGGNMTQSNSIAYALYDLVRFPPVFTGIILAALTALVLLGGIKSIGKVCAYLVPVMAILYFLGGFGIIVVHIQKVPAVFVQIVTTAFSGQAVVGGFLGAGIMAALQMGAARGISTNEAGLGSAPIAAAAAKTDVPGRQALISMSGVFLSSIIMCSLTAFVIGVTGVLGNIAGDGFVLNGAPLVMHAFRSVFPGSEIIVVVGLVLFGYSTIIGWAYYGEKSIEYLAGVRTVRIYRGLFCAFVFIGAVLSMDVVWPLVDIMNGLMALPNLIGLFFLMGVITVESHHFFALLKQEKKAPALD